jgi:thymidine kinase
MIKVITGPMFSGKSTELFNLINKLEENDITYQIFKPSKDKRDTSWLRARTTDRQIGASVISDLNEIENKLTQDTSFIIIDEIQFLTGDVKELIKLSKKGYRIVCAGLSLTSELEPFGLMPAVLSVADEIIKLQSKCTICSEPANYTATTIKKDKTAQIRTGSAEYFPICFDCLDPSKI